MQEGINPLSVAGTDFSLFFIRRVYFLRDAPEKAIFFFHRAYDPFIPTVEWDWENQPMLQEYADRKDEIDILEWTVPDPQVEELCARAGWLGVEKTEDGGFKLIDATDYDISDQPE